MTCALPDGIEIEFPHSGVRVQPRGGDVQRKKRNYTTSNFTLSKEAGEVIGANVENREPAIFKVDGNPVYRFVILDDSLEFRRNFDREDEALLELYDARLVLSGGLISKSWKKARFNTVVSYILENRDDPYGVIQSVNYAGESEKEKIVSDIEHLPPSQRTLDLDALFNSLSLETRVHPRVPYMEFDNISPLESMEKVTRELEYDFWVDVDGTLNIGLDETWGQVMTILNREETAIRRLDVIEAKNKVDTVITMGPYQPDSEWFQVGSLRGVGQATAPEIDGSAITTHISQGSTLEDVKRIAHRRLLKEIMDDASGSAVFNGLATDDKETLGKLTVGDHVIIDGSAFDSCDTSVQSGQYVVKNVHHRINPRQGWRVDIDIARAVTDIDLDTWFYDPQDDKRYDTLEAYQSAQILGPRPGEVE